MSPHKKQKNTQTTLCAEFTLKISPVFINVIIIISAVFFQSWYETKECFGTSPLFPGIQGTIYLL